MTVKFKLALIKAVKKNSLTSIEQLLSNKSVEFDINKVADYQNWWTILAVAVQNSHIEVVELLLTHGADPNCRDLSGNTPLHICFKTRNILLMNLMLKYQGDVNVKNRKGQNALHHAASNGTCEMMESLIRMGMNVNEKDSFGWTPLHATLQAFNSIYTEDMLSKIRLLVNSGADINAFDRYAHFTPLGWAVDSRLPEVINCLLELGADPNVHGDESPLFSAVIDLDIKLVELLIKYGANVHFKNADGCSLLNTVMSIEWWSGDEDDFVDFALDSTINFLIVQVLLIKGVTLTEDDDWDIEPSRFQELKDCESEYKNLKGTRICKSSPLTYGNLLIISNVILARHLRRKDICAAIESGDYKKDFINYFFENIKKKYLRGLELKKMFDDFIDLLDEVFGTVLDHDVVVLISQYFNEDDLNKCFIKNQENS